VWVHRLNKKCRGLNSIKLTKYTIYTNINACRVQQRYSQIIKFTQQHIIKYKSRCSSITYILSRFLLTIFHACHKQYSAFLPTPQLGATTLGLRIEPENTNSPVLELRFFFFFWPKSYNSRLTITPSVKPHTSRENNYTSARATYPKLTFYNTAHKSHVPAGQTNTWVLEWSFVYQNISIIKIITCNSTNPCRIGLYWGCRTSMTA
jgi:hypothetical protein